MSRLNAHLLKDAPPGRLKKNRYRDVAKTPIKLMNFRNTLSRKTLSLFHCLQNAPPILMIENILRSPVHVILTHVKDVPSSISSNLDALTACLVRKRIVEGCLLACQLHVSSCVLQLLLHPLEYLVYQELLRLFVHQILCFNELSMRASRTST